MAPNIIAVRRNLRAFAIIALIYQLLVLFMYGFFIRYRDVQVLSYDFLRATGLSMIVLVGVGLSLCYIRDVPLSAIGFVMLLASITFQHYFLINAFWTKAQIQPSPDDYFTRQAKEYIGLTLGQYTNNANDFNDKLYTVTYAFRCILSMCGAYGCILGRVGPLELLLMSLFGTITFELNSQLVRRYALDLGGSITVFTFGGFLGLSTSIFMNNAKNSTYGRHIRNVSSRWSAALGLLGAMFVWALFPVSFSNLVYKDVNNGLFNAMRYAEFFNIIIAQTSSVISCFLTTLMFRSRIEIRDLVLSATAVMCFSIFYVQYIFVDKGGVSVAASANIISNPAAALTVGFVAGVVETMWTNLAERYVNKTFIRDTAGTFGLFGIAGFLGGVWSAIYTSFQQDYNSTKTKFSIPQYSLTLSTGAKQFAATCMSMGIAALTGLFLGLLFRLINQNDPDDQLTDTTYWTTEDDGISSVLIVVPPGVGEVRPGSQIKGKYAYM